MPTLEERLDRAEQAVAEHGIDISTHLAAIERRVLKMEARVYGRRLPAKNRDN